MSLTIPSGVQTKLDATDLGQYVVLVRINFGHGNFRYWSTEAVDPGDTFDGLTYEARIEEIPELSFGGSSPGEVTLRVGNVDNYGVNLIDKGLRMHRARVAIVVLYPSVEPPNNAVGDWTNPYWQGSITGYKLDEEWLELNCEPGFVELNRQHPLLGHSCLNNFADGLFCGYDPIAGHGIPERRFTGSATGGSATTLVDSGADFSVVQDGWLVFNTTDLCIGTVTNVATTTLTVDDFVNGTVNTFSASDGYIVGPPHTSCPKSKTGCIERGMFALETTGAQNLRWFRNLADPARVPFLTRVFTNAGKRRLSWVSGVSDSNDSRPIPMAFGVTRNRDMIQLGQALEDESEPQPFVNALWLASVGRCWSAAALDLDGYPIDDVDFRGHATGTATGGSSTTLVDSSKNFPDLADTTMHVYNLTDGSVGKVTGVSGSTLTCSGGFVQGSDNTPASGDSYLVTNAHRKDSLVLFNFSYSGSDDQGLVDAGVLTTEQQRLGIASREARAVIRGTDLDTYFSNPYLFEDDTGDGPSRSGLSLIRTRHQPNGFSGNLKGSAQLIGVWTRMPPGSTAQADDGGVTDWTKFPNPVQVAYHYLRYVHGWPDSRFESTLLVAASDHCQTSVSSSQSHLSNITGTVAYGPDDADTTTSLKNFFVTEADVTGSSVGGTVTVQTSGGPVSRTVVTVISVRREEDRDRNPEIGGNFFDVPDASQGMRVSKIIVDSDFPSDHMPASGDSFTIFAAGSVGASVRRYKFNGIVDLGKPAEEVVRAILANCNGKQVYKAGRWGVVIPTTVDEAALASQTIFTDKGTSPNIIRDEENNFKSTAEWDADEWEDIANEVTVEFPNRERDYEGDSRKVYNETSQLYVAEAFGEAQGRDKADKTLSLNGSSSLDQALRLAALKIREGGPYPGNRENGTLTFQISLHDFQGLVPWEDVRLIETDVLPSYLRGRPFRLIELEPDLETMRATTKWRPHVNAWYDDTTHDVGVEELPNETDFQPDGRPLQTKIESLTDQGFNTGDGNREERVLVEWTNPTIPA